MGKLSRPLKLFALGVIAASAGSGVYWWKTRGERLEAVTAAVKPPSWFIRMNPHSKLSDVRIGREIWKAMAADVPSAIEWKLKIPEQAQLQFAVSAHPDPGGTKRDDAAEDLTMRVEIDGAKLFEQAISSTPNWRNASVDLAAHSGKEATIVFRAESKLAKPPRVLWGCPQIVSAKREDDRPNILVLSVDTLRADHLKCYGYKRNTSPSIDKLAAEGWRFDRCYTTQGATWPALTSLMTSMQPSTHGVTWNGYQLKEGVISLAEIFASQGYATAAMLANMSNGTHRGFDRRFAEKDQKLLGTYLKVLREDKDKPFFHWVHFIGPHDSYEPPPPFDTYFGKPAEPGIGSHIALSKITLSGKAITPEQRRDVLMLYDGEIRAVDSYVNRIMKEIRKLGLEKRLIIIFTADHGEELFDHDNYSFHSISLYDSGLHIPLIFSGVPGVAEGSVDRMPVSIVDVAPTILQLAGLQAPSSFQGRSLLLPADGRRGEALSETWEDMFTIVDSNHRFIHNPNNITPKSEARGYTMHYETEELYAFPADPLQRKNIIEKFPEIAADLRTRLIRWKEQVAKSPVERQELEENTKEELRELGYID